MALEIAEGLGKLRVRFGVATDDGTKTFYEQLGYVKARSNDDIKEDSTKIINGLGVLFDNYSVDEDKTTLTYTLDANDLASQTGEDWEDQTAPEDTRWNLKMYNQDALGNNYNEVIGYIEGDITEAKITAVDELARAFNSFSTNTYSDTILTATIYPLKEV